MEDKKIPNNLTVIIVFIAAMNLLIYLITQVFLLMEFFATNFIIWRVQTDLILDMLTIRRYQSGYLLSGNFSLVIQCLLSE
ncbi:MAG: hypothetical protein M5T52_15660 [Ignavibacteriaceae bacterium]|nr:hypothetical protein [Ignavibacteriaceae bacterium]